MILRLLMMMDNGDDNDDDNNDDNDDDHDDRCLTSALVAARADRIHPSKLLSVNASPGRVNIHVKIYVKI